ncbi:MAG: class I adenylate-forming enzyme family protein [Actinomycetota bacterium]|nr:AMP-binding protein [Actinomycetota bacterium]
MEGAALVAVDTSDPERFVETLTQIWESGDAVMPVDHRLTRHEHAALIGRMKPLREITAEGSTQLEGEPVRPGTALVIATSGTSGPPQGVVISHAALRWSTEASNLALDAQGSDTWVSVLPLAHIAAIQVVNRALVSGAKLVMMPRFDPASTVKAGTSICVSLVPALLRKLLDADVELTAIRTVLLGGGPVPVDLIDEGRDRGLNIVTTYGMTETCGGCVYDGAPLRGVHVKIGQDSSIQISGPCLLDGYRSDALSTRERLVDGWFSTRDAGALDDSGRLSVFGRADDVIVTGGEKVWPREVEEVLSRVPGVEEVAICSVPDPTWGQVIVAVIVPRGHAPTLELIRSLAAEQLAPYKLPRRLMLVESLPRNALGKVDIRKLSALIR